MNVRLMTIADYERVYTLWLNTTNMGLNNIDDSKDGINKYLLRNPDTCFVAEKDGVIIGVILVGMTDAGDIFTTQRSHKMNRGMALVLPW